MNRVGGVGRPPSPGDKQPERKSQKKKSKDAPNFEDVMKKKGGKGKGGRGEAAPQKSADGAAGGVGGKGAPGGKRPPGGKGAVGGKKEDAVQFSIHEKTIRKDQKMMETYRRETVKQQKMGEETTEVIGQTQQVAGITHEAAQVQEAKAPSLPPELVQKLVESVRVGQNRMGATEMQLGLKATVFEGMNLKISSKDGIVQVVMEVEQLAAKEKLEGEISQLQDRLEEQGLSVGDITVQLKGSGGGGPGTQGGDQTEGDASTPYDGRPGGQNAPGSSPAAGGTGRKPDSSTDYTL